MAIVDPTAADRRRVQTSGRAAPPARAYVYGFGCFLLWGMFPLYFRLLERMPADLLVSYRICGTALLLTALATARGRVSAVVAALRTPAILRRLSLSGALIAFNWVLYIWAVTNGHIVEASLGYYINPLINVVLGVAALGERLRPVQWLAVVLAALAVTLAAVLDGRPPWIALLLAFSFGVYGLVRKTTPVSSIVGLHVETMLLVGPALAYLLITLATDPAAFVPASLGGWLLLSSTAVATTVPLVMFGAAAQLLPLATLGLIQYLSPTITLIIATTIMGEPFRAAQAATFGLIWIALALYSGGLLMARRRVAEAPAR